MKKPSSIGLLSTVIKLLPPGKRYWVDAGATPEYQGGAETEQNYQDLNKVACRTRTLHSSESHYWKIGLESALKAAK